MAQKLFFIFPKFQLERNMVDKEKALAKTKVLIILYRAAWWGILTLCLFTSSRLEGQMPTVLRSAWRAWFPRLAGQNLQMYTAVFQVRRCNNLQHEENSFRNQVSLLTSHALTIETSTLLEIPNGLIYGRCPCVALSLNPDVLRIKMF